MVNLVIRFLDTEILSGIGLPELPVRWRYVPRGSGTAVTGGNSKGKCLTGQDRVRLPVLPPVTAHAHPVGLRALDPHFLDITCPRDIADQNQVKVAESVNCEPYPARFSTGYPANYKTNVTTNLVTQK